MSRAAPRTGLDRMLVASTRWHIDALPQLYGTGKSGGGGDESHTTYPVLCSFAHRPWLNWIIGSCRARRGSDADGALSTTAPSQTPLLVWLHDVQSSGGFAGYRSIRPDPTRRSRCLRGVLQRRRQVESIGFRPSAAPKRRGRTFGLADQLREFGLPFADSSRRPSPWSAPA